jgi:aminodeoxyfutalosine synthase
LSDLTGPSAIDDLKTLAISRLMLDNFPHIKAFWIMLGAKLSQISLCFGVDDMDGTVMEERITHMAGAQTPQGLATFNEALIHEAGASRCNRIRLSGDRHEWLQRYIARKARGRVRLDFRSLRLWDLDL